MGSAICGVCVVVDVGGGVSVGRAVGACEWRHLLDARRTALYQ